MSPELIDRFAAIVGPANALRDPADQERYLVEWRGLWHGETPVVLRPGSTAEVARILELAHETGTRIVPQGGNTGLVGGQVPAGDEVLVSLGRMKRIRSVDPAGDTIIVDAGATLSEVQQAAEDVDRLFPLSLASEGSCQIGGNLATNAGGTAVLAYGTMRDLVLGLEVVLADGRIWNGLRTLRKDNTGYDLRHLFVGSEGTLGIVTGAALKLFPKPRSRVTAMAATPSPADALRLFSVLRGTAGGTLTTFEILPRIGLDFVLRHAAGTRDPFGAPHDWYLLIEVSSGVEEATARDALEADLAGAFEEGLLLDAVVARSGNQASAFWRLREMLSEVQSHEGGSIKHDVSVPVAKVPEFLARAGEAVIELLPEARLVPFGHLGDGNIHFNVSQPPGMDKARFLSMWDEMNERVHGVAAALGGSISAEHGIGQLKRRLLPRVKDPVEYELMLAIKRTLDPQGLLNPGKVLELKE
ncbi:FAD-binding oxidoreductase [Lutibaculum baratangense]|uniref:D-2-hydroxyglutarate dehydrogenase n=1 Tax=Lutibaculum baratangense AMV1 TaxID=631454 RepID=V4RNH0_9HYPH|nr:FAD-binding oxidoreductase [Lutibaculum baratangense]ESR24755.1 D-2-hydroxyglutarate dehydrogenase [Lutibaculum baratangense AMV1]